MESIPQTRAEGGVGDAGEHKALHRAAHITPIVNYQGIQHNGDYCPHNSVDDFKSFHIHVVFSCFSVLILRPRSYFIILPENDYHLPEE